MSGNAGFPISLRTQRVFGTSWPNISRNTENVGDRQFQTTGSQTMFGIQISRTSRTTENVGDFVVNLTRFVEEA